MACFRSAQVRVDLGLVNMRWVTSGIGSDLRVDSISSQRDRLFLVAICYVTQNKVGVILFISKPQQELSLLLGISNAS